MSGRTSSSPAAAVIYIYKRNQQFCKIKKFKIEIVKKKSPCTTSLLIASMTRDIREGTFLAIPIPSFVILKPTGISS
jgi:hypothetical protein